MTGPAPNQKRSRHVDDVPSLCHDRDDSCRAIYSINDINVQPPRTKARDNAVSEAPISAELSQTTRVPG